MNATSQGARTCVIGLIACCLWFGSAVGLTRNDALWTAWTYFDVLYDVTTDNTYPAVSCYDPSDSLYLAKLPPGSWVGLPYSYREGEPFTPSEIIGHLYEDHRGAGSSQEFAVRDYPCVRDHVTGIDCSQLVSAAWQQVPRVTTSGIPGVSVLLTSISAIKPADAFCKAEWHVLLFRTAPSAAGYFGSLESNGTERKVVQLDSLSFDDLYERGYRPYCSVKLKDDPAADVFAFCAGRRGDQVVVAWETLLERDTQGFVVERGACQDGPFAAVSDVLARRGGDTSGARYEFIDASYPGGAVYYQLREIETNGRELLHGVVGSVDLAAGGGGR